MSVCYIPDVGTVREFCTDFDTTCWTNCSCSLTLERCTQYQHHLHGTVLMQALVLSVFDGCGSAPKPRLYGRVTVMQLNAKGPGCKPQGADCSHVLDSGKHVLGPRLSATTSDHAFRTRFLATPSGHVFQPRLPATSSDMPSRIEDVMPLGRTGCTTEFTAQ